MRAKWRMEIDLCAKHWRSRYRCSRRCRRSECFSFSIVHIWIGQLPWERIHFSISFAPIQHSTFYSFLVDGIPCCDGNAPKKNRKWLENGEMKWEIRNARMTHFHLISFAQAINSFFILFIPFPSCVRVLFLSTFFMLNVNIFWLNWIERNEKMVDTWIFCTLHFYRRHKKWGNSCKWERCKLLRLNV